MKINNKLIVLVFRVGIVLAAVFFYYQTLEIKELTTQKPGKFEVVEKKCRLRHGGSYINVIHIGKVYRVEYYGEKCYELDVGGVVELYYSKENDLFYAPDDYHIYKWYVYGLLVLLVLTFIPWYRLSKKSKQ